MTREPIYPFSNGFEYRAWQERNCARCALFTTVPTCDLEIALGMACLGDGTISQETATRLGYTPERIYQDGVLILGWPCMERQLLAGERP